MSSVTRVRVAVPTKDRPGTIGTALTCIALALTEGDELVLYDDGDREAQSDAIARFALDLALTRGAHVAVKRGRAQGIGNARAAMLEDAELAGVPFLVMVDDDVMITARMLRRLTGVLEESFDAQYAVPIVGLANDEAGTWNAPGADVAHQQRYGNAGIGTEMISGGAWTCAIALAMDRVQASSLASQLRSGPSVVEDYVLTRSLSGVLARDQIAWHAMSPEQGHRDWNGKALGFLRDQLR